MKDKKAKKSGKDKKSCKEVKKACKEDLAFLKYGYFSQPFWWGESFTESFFGGNL